MDFTLTFKKVNDKLYQVKRGETGFILAHIEYDEEYGEWLFKSLCVNFRFSPVDMLKISTFIFELWGHT